MKKALFIITAILLIVTHVQGLARSVDVATARKAAMDFLQARTPSGRLMASAPHELWLKEEPGPDASGPAAYYVVGTDKGFVIVAGDDRARQVLAYSDQPLEDMDAIPGNMRFFMELYKRQIGMLQAHPDLVPTHQILSESDNTIESVPPLLTSSWGQSFPYNVKCPFVNNERAFVGCSAIALAQVMRYWQFPSSCDSLPAYTTRTLGIEVPMLEPTSFDWKLMLDQYKVGGSYTTEELNAATTMLRYVSQAENMDFKYNASDADEYDIMNAIRFFGFDSNACFVEKSSIDGEVFYSDMLWEMLLYNELKKRRPVIYCGYAQTSDSTMTGHAFNVDGYNADDGTFHVNFGWRGTGDGYYALHAFTLKNNTYDIGQIMYMGVEPPPPVPEITVSDQELNLSCYVGDTVSSVITVTGTNLTHEITTTLNSTCDDYSISVSQDSLGCIVITITYNPQSAGQSSASIIFSSEGAQDVSVIIHGNSLFQRFTPVMMVADSAQVTSTAFMAQWTDETQPDLVQEYILETADNESFITDSAEYHIFAGIDTTAFNIEGLTPGATYYYRVRALYNDSTCSEWSNVQAVTLPVPEPQRFTPVMMEADSAQVTSTAFMAQWTDETQPGLIQEYILEAADNDSFATDSAEYHIFTGIDTTAFNIEGLTPGVTYYYRVKALYNDSTCSEWSNVQSVTLTVPEPQCFTPVMMEADSAQVTSTAFLAQWTDETQPDLVQEYILEAASSESFATDSAEYHVFTGIDTTAFNIEGLTPGVTYYYRVKALYNDSTCSEWSNAQSVTLPIPEPQRFTPVMMVADSAQVTSTAFLAQWTDETQPDIVQEYILEAASSKSFATDSAEYHVFAGIDTTAFNIEGLTPGVTYYYRVRALYNDSTYSEWSNVQSVTLPIPEPQRFTPVMMEADSAQVTSTAFMAQWTDETQPDLVQEYILEAASSESFATDSAEYQVFAGIDTTAFNIEGLTPGVTYYYRVKALYNDSTCSEWSNVQSVTLPVPEPQRFTPVMMVADSAQVTSTAFMAQWTDETQPDLVQEYILETADNESFITDSAEYHIFAGIDTTAFNIEGLTPGATYYYRVRALYNDSTCSEWSNVQSVTLPIPEPQRFTPVMMEADSAQVTSTAFMAQWTDETQPDLVLEYILEAADNDCFATDSAEYHIFTGIDTTAFNIEGLTPGVTYYYRVKALYNDSTYSEWSNVQSVTLPVPAVEHEYELGDVNHDHMIGIADLAWLIDLILNMPNNACLICADVSQDGIIDIADITRLIDKSLNSQTNINQDSNR